MWPDVPADQEKYAPDHLIRGYKNPPCKPWTSKWKETLNTCFIQKVKKNNLMQNKIISTQYVIEDENGCFDLPGIWTGCNWICMKWSTEVLTTPDEYNA